MALTYEGKRYDFDMPPNGERFAGRCARGSMSRSHVSAGCAGRCRATLTAGKVDIRVNYVLEDDELARGAILMCQSHPLTADVAL